MKKYIYIQVITLALLLGASCESFTELGLPETQLGTDAVFENEGTATAAISDLYARIRETGISSGTISGVSYLMGVYGDELSYTSSNADILAFENHTHVASNSLVQGLWNSGYAEIYAANAIIEGLDASTSIAEQTKNNLKGEALFLRAYLHFQLVSLFGDIPYVTTTNYQLNSVISKTARDQVLENIKADLDMAREMLPESYAFAQPVRVTRAAATAFLARVCLYTGDYENALVYAGETISNPSFSLVMDVGTVFLKESTESIWCQHPGIEGLNTKDARAFVFTSAPPTKAFLSADLKAAFEPGDLRRAAWVKDVTSQGTVWSHSFKYQKTNNTGTSVEYTIMLRLSEQYLIRAEARVHNGDLEGAREDLNLIRSRAGLQPSTAQGTEDLLAAILQERRVELFTEQGLRWFDLTRTGTANTIMPNHVAQWQPGHVLLPLPQSELLLNGNLMPQNPEY